MSNQIGKNISSIAAKVQNSSRAASPKRVVMHTRRIPNTVAVLHVPESTVVSLDFCLSGVGAKGGWLEKCMERDAQEPALRTVERLRLMCATQNTHRGKKTSKEEVLAACPPVKVFGSGTPRASADECAAANELDAGDVELDTALSNAEFWQRARLIFIQDVKVVVRYNVPTITSITPPSKPHVGFPVSCFSIRTLFSAEENICYEWCIHSGDSQNDEALTVLSTDPTFVPTSDLVGKVLILRVTPDRATGLWTYVELPPVQEVPPPVERWNATQKFVGFPAFRVVTYNILFENFCMSGFARANIYPFASEAVLATENRQVRILQELLAYHADIICLQECGKTIFTHFLLPSMRALGYDGHYFNKNGTTSEGCGFLYKRDRFTLVEKEVLPLNWDTLAAEHADLAAAVASHAELKEALSCVTSIGTAQLLRENASGSEVVVGNTHLFYHAVACHIRALQAYMLMHLVDQVSKRALPSQDAPPRSIVICGDFNTTHVTGAYRLLTTGQLEANHFAWSRGKLFWWGCDSQLGCSEEKLEELQAARDSPDTPQPTAGCRESAVDKVGDPAHNPVVRSAEKRMAAARLPLSECFSQALQAPFRLVDAYGRTDPAMQWTNYTMGFREVIDYIFFSEKNLDVLSTVPIPPESELAENCALPNAKYPSDHVALIADLAFKR